MKRTKVKHQMTLALPLDAAASDADLEAAVRAAELSFLADAVQPEAAPLEPSNLTSPASAPIAETRAPAGPASPDARSGRQTLYVVSAMRWGEMRARRGTKLGWQRLPDAGFKVKGQALRAAEQMVEAGRATGAVAVQQTADPDAGDYDEPVVLASYGRLPEGFAEI
jgi:hypothetical protein